MAFKMKGWSGSPVRQNPKVNLKESIENLRQRIGIKPITHDPTTGKSTSGFGLTKAEKAQAKKSGMSEWQWKTSKSKSGTRANKWVKREGDDNSYQRTDNSVKVEIDGRVVEDFNTKSTNYQSVTNIISDIEEEEEFKHEFEGNMPENVVNYLQREISSNQKSIKKEKNDHLLDNKNPDLGYMYEEDIDLIKSDPLAYLNQRLTMFKKEYKENQEDVFDHNDDYYVDDITELESLIKELKNK